MNDCVSTFFGLAATCARHSKSWNPNWPMSRKRNTPPSKSAARVRQRSTQGDIGSQSGSSQSARAKPVVSGALRAAVTETQTTSYEGPLPPSAELQAYEQIQPGAADRIISMAERYGEHRQYLESQSMKNAFSTHRTGQFIGGFVVASILAVCGYALHLGHVGFASKLGTGTIVALAAIFVLDRLPQWRHLWRHPPSEDN